MSDFEEIPDWYDEEKDDEDFDPNDPTVLNLPIPKKSKSQPVKKSATKKKKKISKTQQSDEDEGFYSLRFLNSKIFLFKLCVKFLFWH